MTSSSPVISRTHTADPPDTTHAISNAPAMSDHATALIRAKQRVKERREMNALLGIVSARVQPSHLARPGKGSTHLTVVSQAASHHPHSKQLPSPQQQAVIPPVVYTPPRHEESGLPQTQTSTQSYQRQSLIRGSLLHQSIQRPTKHNSVSFYTPPLQTVVNIPTLQSVPNRHPADADQFPKSSQLELLQNTIALQSTHLDLVSDANPTHANASLSKKEKRRIKKTSGGVDEIELIQKPRRIIFRYNSGYTLLHKTAEMYSKLPASLAIFHPLSHSIYAPPTWTQRIRVLEDEGIYVGAPPYMHPYNVKTLNRRLQITEENHGQRWIGNGPQVLIEPDPMQYTHNRYNRPVFTSPAATYGYGNAAINSNTSNATDLYLERQMPIHSSDQSNDLSRPNSTYLLTVDLVSVRFQDHPLMSLEQRLAGSIVEILNTMRELPFSDSISRSAEIPVDHPSLPNMPHSVQKTESGGVSSAQKFQGVVLSRLHELEKKERARIAQINDESIRFRFLQDIQATRLLRDTEAQTDRLLEFKILKAWQDLKQLRSNSKFLSTNLNLKIIIRNTVDQEDNACIDQEVERELCYLKEIHNIEHTRRMRIYQKLYDNWSSQNSEVHQSLLQRQNGPDRIDPTDPEIVRDSTISRDSNDAQIGNSKQITSNDTTNFEAPGQEPKLKRFHYNRLRLEIVKRMQAARRPPGSPLLSFIQDSKNIITPLAECSKEEITRRREIDATFFYLRYYYNNKEVMRTVARPVDPSTFTLQFNGIEDLSEAEHLVKAQPQKTGAKEYSKSVFGIHVSEPPVSMRVEIFEAGVFGDVLSGEVHIPIPSSEDFTETIDREMNVSWSMDGSISTSEIPKVQNQRRSDPISFHGPPGHVNLPNLMKYVADMKVDPNDPRNGDILKLKSLVESVSGGCHLSAEPNNEYWKSRSIFRLGLPTWLHNLTLYVGPREDAKQGKRLVLLAARFRKEIQMQKPMPVLESDIKEDTYQVTEKNDCAGEDLQASSQNLNLISTPSASNRAEREIHIGFIKRVRELQLIRKAKLARPVTVDDFVREECLTPAPEQRSSLEMLFAPRRPLNPYRIDRHEAAGSTISPDHCQIVVQVLRAHNLPVRKSAIRQPKPGLLASHHQADPIATEYVAPYVEVSFQQNTIRTATAHSQNPQWNETIGLNIDVPDDNFRPEALCETDIGTQMLFINVFDEVIVDMIHDDRERATSIHHRIERSWLGSLQVPFSTIWEQTRINGTFAMKLPAQSLGYEINSVEETHGEEMSGDRKPLLDLFITLDPPLLQPPTLKLLFQSDEERRLLNHSTLWLSSLAPLKRIVMATSLDLQGKTRLICRYIRPQEPPASLSTIAHLRRFVSMIPYMPNRTAFGCECSLLSNTREMIEVGAANGVEHAILLCNFLLARGCNAYVVLGRGIPEGMTAYVLVQPPPVETPNIFMISQPAATDPNPLLKNKAETHSHPMGQYETVATDIASRRWLVFHPVTGDEHDLNDPHIPLKEIGCIFNNENIWANIQIDTSPLKVHLRLEDLGGWKPFFGPQFRCTDMRSIQPEKVKFSEVLPKYLSDLELSLEAGLISKIEEWRQDRVTRWNRMCSRTFKTLLMRLESTVIRGVSISGTLESSPELASIGHVYRLHGFPLNIPFTDLASVCSMIQNTAVHINNSPGVEFALAVHCFGYSGNFVSVWVYFASLVRNEFN
ncbi:hypothetical protein BASA62_000424 [Batrachochytrium salamandrivorans]|nr:hypothetical protein BASA62_000424 [Batrachochytrium salamandrivorans]